MRTIPLILLPIALFIFCAECAHRQGIFKHYKNRRSEAAAQRRRERIPQS
jgi:hypothetical protein